MMTRFVVLLILIPGIVFAAQPTKTFGPCSPIVINNSGSFSINCQGISEQQAEQLQQIMNKILEEKLDFNVVIKKLDEILVGVNHARDNADIARTETLRLKNKFTPRSVSDEQKKILEDELKNLKGEHVSVIITDNEESVLYGEEIAAELEKIGFKVYKFIKTVLPIEYGIIVTSPMPYNTKQNGGVIFQNALSKAGIEYRIGQIHGPGFGIFVGLKKMK